MESILLVLFLVASACAVAELQSALTAGPRERPPAPSTTRAMMRQRRWSNCRLFGAGCFWAWVCGCGVYCVVRLSFPEWRLGDGDGGESVDAAGVLAVLAALGSGPVMAEAMRQTRRLASERADRLQDETEDEEYKLARMVPENPAASIRWVEERIERLRYSGGRDAKLRIQACEMAKRRFEYESRKPPPPPAKSPAVIVMEETLALVEQLADEAASEEKKG